MTHMAQKKLIVRNGVYVAAKPRPVFHGVYLPSPPCIITFFLEAKNGLGGFTK